MLPFQIDQSDDQQSYGDDGVEGNRYELLQKFMESLEVQKEQLSKELKEKDNIIEAQKKELAQKQKVIDKQERMVANRKLQKQKVKEIETITIIKQRQIRLIACSKKILDAGANVAESSLRYLYAIIMVHDTEDRRDEQAITYESRTQGRTVTEVVDVGSVRIVDHENIATLEKEWEKQTADKVLTELEEALKTDNYDAMEKQQSKYALASSDPNSVDAMLASIKDLKKNVESTYSRICVPPEAKQENVDYLIEVIVRFAIALNSFHEAICSMYEEKFDLSNMILLSLEHPVYVQLFKMLNSLIDALQRAAQWLHNAICKQQ